MDHNQNKTAETKSPGKRKDRCFDQFKIFLAALGFSFICKTLGGVLMKSSLTQIEKRFEISSSTSGLLDGGFDLGNLFVIVFVSYFGAKLHRPKLIGIGSLIMGTGSLVIVLPHFLMGRYRYSTEISSNPLKSIIPTCSVNQTLPLSEASPEILGKGKEGCDKGSEGYYWLYVLLGNMLRGVGETPIMPLGISYMDDFSKGGNSSVYLGCLQAIAMIGPILGFIMSSVFSRLYVDIGFVDLKTVRINPKDARWVGAWWLGFLVSALLSFLSAIPFFFLPKNPNDPQASEKDSGSVRKEEAGLQAHLTDQEQHAPSPLSGFLTSMKSILSNKLYVLYLIMSLLHLSTFIGSFSYVFKYIEQQYGQPSSHTNFLLGVITLPAVASGMLLGGYLIKKFKLTVVGIGKMSFCFCLMAVLLHVTNYMLICERRQVAGLTVAYDGSSLPVQSPMNAPLKNMPLLQCNADCGCEESHWEPVCGANGLMYFSPCLAGCSAPDEFGTRNHTVFYNCSCVQASGFQKGNYSAYLGECPRSDDCKKKFNIYMGMQVIYSFITALGGPAFVLLLVRLVEPELKSLAMGFHSLIIRTAGGILAPIYFGTLIDRTCVKWSITPCGKKGACRMYNSTLFGISFLGIQSGLKSLAIIFYVALIWAMKKKYEGKATKEMGNGEKAPEEATVESVNNNGHLVSETHI
ncbi:solute carrier organic anion transporter family member 1B3-like isoform 2-T4 [Thomomys bottae]